MTSQKIAALPANLPPRGISRQAAAAYIGVSATTFDKLVRDGRMPRAIKINGRSVWDRHRLDFAFDALSDLIAREDDPWSVAA